MIYIGIAYELWGGLGIIFITEMGLIVFGSKIRHRCGGWTDDDNFKKSANSPFFIYIPTLTGGISIEINIGGHKILNRPDK